MQLKHLSDEKHQVTDEINKLQTEIFQYKIELSDQVKKYQTVLSNERTLQEAFEERWGKLIDQARSETKSMQKKIDETMNKQNDKIGELQNNLTKLQDALIEARTTLNHKNEMIILQKKKQIERAEDSYLAVVSQLVAVKSNTQENTDKKYVKKQIKSV